MSSRKSKSFWSIEKQSPIRQQSDKKEDKSPFRQLTIKNPTILAKPANRSSTASPFKAHQDWKEVPSSPGPPVAPKLSFTIAKESESKQAAADSLKPGSGDSVAGSSEDEEFVWTSSVKMIDSNLQWKDNGLDKLKDQEDFLVVGVLGLQGVGKSTILSMLAGKKFVEGKDAWFREQTTDQKEKAHHMTNGVEFAVTQERMILLDCQPMLSPSILDELIYERNNKMEFTGPSIQMQSLQIATFMLTVCHVVLVVQDYFTDPSFYSFIQRAEIARLPTPFPHGTKNSMRNKEAAQHQPVAIFVHNKLDSEMFDINRISSMNSVVSALTRPSSLYCRGQFSLLASGLYPGLNNLHGYEEEANHFCFPHFDSYEEEDNEKFTKDPNDLQFLSLKSYDEKPELDHLTEAFIDMILSVPRRNISHQVLTEKSWFHYAARTWESLKKSSVITEFSRLISS